VGIEKPFYRNYRPNSGNSGLAYITDKKYAVNPANYTRAFIIILDELKELFEFIEPCDTNLETYSFRIHQLIIRTCIEVEANFKAILRENTFNPKDNNRRKRQENSWNINDFRIVNKTHHLDAYLIGIPLWVVRQNEYTPFKNWGNEKDLSWYQAYNKSKHDRAKNFKEANLKNLLGAVAGLLALLSSQFCTENFSPGNDNLVLEGNRYYKGDFGIGDYFTVKFPDNWKDEEKYHLDWTELKEDIFQKFDYDEIQK